MLSLTLTGSLETLELSPVVRAFTGWSDSLFDKLYNAVCSVSRRHHNLWEKGNSPSVKINVYI